MLSRNERAGRFGAGEAADTKARPARCRLNGWERLGGGERKAPGTEEMAPNCAGAAGLVQHVLDAQLGHPLHADGTEAPPAHAEPARLDLERVGGCPPG